MLKLKNGFQIYRTAEFLILDDDKSLNELTDNLKNHWIQIDAMLGITESIKNQILEKINNFNYR